jgi:hypothetical protein
MGDIYSLKYKLNIIYILMTTVYTKSYSTDFNSSLNFSEFHIQISENVGITPNIIGLNRNDDIINIIFDAELSEDELTILNNLISSYILITTVYTKSYSTDFNSSLNFRQFHTQISENVGITPNIVGINRNDDIINIIFDTTLSEGEQTILNNLVSSHTPIIYNSYVNSIVNIQKKCNFSTFTNFSTYIYPGSNHHKKISKINVISHMDSTLTDYHVRIYDYTNKLVLIDKTLTNTSTSISIIDTISNIPTDEVILEIQIKTTGATSTTFAFIESVSFYFEN